MKPSCVRGLRVACAAAAVSAAIAGGIAACGSDQADDGLAGADGGGLHRDGSEVDPLDANGVPDGGTGLTPPSCSRYCELVQNNCAGGEAQYRSDDECLALCAHLPLGDGLKEDAPDLGCRQYYAGNPARTDPPSYCPAAGPFGGGRCGDRCTAFCQVALSACSPDRAPAPYASYSDCATACAGFSFVDAGADGGGEGAFGPEGGDTLNCRLFHLRDAVVDASACMEVAPEGGPCHGPPSSE